MSKAPFKLNLIEPNVTITTFTENDDSGITIDMPGVTVAFSANQTIALLEALKKIEPLMLKEITEGRGGRQGEMRAP